MPLKLRKKNQYLPIENTSKMKKKSEYLIKYLKKINILLLKFPDQRTLFKSIRNTLRIPNSMKVWEKYEQSMHRIKTNSQ
jgi:hypothetical protein